MDSYSYWLSFIVLLDEGFLIQPHYWLWAGTIGLWWIIRQAKQRINGFCYSNPTLSIYLINKVNLKKKVKNLSNFS